MADAMADIIALWADARDLIAEVGDAVESLDSFDHRLEVAGMLEDLRLDIAAIVASNDARMVEAAPDPFGTFDVPGGGIYKIGGGRERKRYDAERLISTYAERMMGEHGIAAMVTADGETLDAREVVNDICQTIAAAAGATAPSFSGWRSGVAKRYGISLNTYADLEESPRRGRIESRPRSGGD